MASSGRRIFVCCPTELDPPTNHLTEVRKEPQNIFILILSIFLFVLYTLQPEDLVGWLVVRHISGLSSHSILSSSSSFLCHLKAQTPSTYCTPLKKQSQPLKWLHINSVVLIFALLRCCSRKGGNNRRTLLLEVFYVFWTSRFKVPHWADCWRAMQRLQDGTEELLLPERVLWRWHRR